MPQSISSNPRLKANIYYIFYKCISSLSSWLGNTLVYLLTHRNYLYPRTSLSMEYSAFSKSNILKLVVSIFKYLFSRPSIPVPVEQKLFNIKNCYLCFLNSKSFQYVNLKLINKIKLWKLYYYLIKNDQIRRWLSVTTVILKCFLLIELVLVELKLGTQHCGYIIQFKRY